ncbi:MAG: dephospho-CoA kinase [Chloroflexi bacterium]|nr:MAG: dephospho-CoA kinase [Chloroflexota bacterium]
MNEEVLLQGKVIVGLTGNIATGKSAVMRLAADKGALTIDADKVVHEIMNTDETMQAALAVAFGAEVRKEDGRIDRKALGKIVFEDQTALQDLEAMMHPIVRRKVAQQIQECDESYIFIEAIKLLEGALATVCHQIWVTRCSQQRQLERLRICRGMETNEATKRIKAQSPQAEKVAQADIVIDTNGYMKDTEVQFRFAWRRLPDPEKAEHKQILVPSKQALAPGKEASGESETASSTALSAGVSTPQKAKPIAEPIERPENLTVRRAKPSDIPGILLLIQRATDGAKKMKRAELLMALSERGYFLGQIDAEINTVAGFSIDSQVARVDELYIHPLEMAGVTGTAVIEDIEQSAFNHMSEIIIIFLPNDAPDEMRAIFDGMGYTTEPKEQLARNWQEAIEESQPENTTFVLKILRDTRM